MHSPIDRERLITMADAGKYLAQRTGHRPYLCTLYRWALRGVSGRRLETVQVGRQRYTSVEAVQRFMHARDEQSVTVVSVSRASTIPWITARGVAKPNVRCNCSNWSIISS